MKIRNIVPTALILGCLPTTFAQVACSATLKSTKPANSYCGGHGTLPSNTPSRASDAGSLNECRDLCLSNADSTVPRREKCVSFSFNKGTGLCKIYRKSLQNLGYQNSPKNFQVSYYDTACYDFSCVCSESIPASPVPGNLIAPDPSFENARARKLQPGLAYLNRSCTPGAAPYDGRGYLTLVRTPDGSSGNITGYIGQSYDVLDLELYARVTQCPPTSKIDGFCWLEFSYNDSSGAYAFQPAGTGQTSWQRVTSTLYIYGVLGEYRFDVGGGYGSKRKVQVDVDRIILKEHQE